MSAASTSASASARMAVALPLMAVVPIRTSASVPNSKVALEMAGSSRSRAPICTSTLGMTGPSLGLWLVEGAGPGLLRPVCRSPRLLGELGGVLGQHGLVVQLQRHPAAELLHV